ncbi:MAG TPA: PKD domain-containing protein, partial [Candidatus Heimdallarchaeota archaeon]|nr:PKD domain-containing protein [Candidatus Heimdallarchaeota archaeon]
MSSPRKITGKSPPRPVAVAWLTIALMLCLMVGLAACRGFFGQAPIALLVITTPADDQEVPVTVTFNISGSNDPDGTIATFDLDFGDGSTHATGTDVSAVQTYPYTVAGTYTVELTITDNDGRIGMASGTVTIGPVMITFASNRPDYDIWRMQVDGTNLTKVLETGDEELFPDLVRGTRGKIAYTAEDGTSWDIWTITVTGSPKAQLTTQTPSNEIQPSWSYNGTKIAYASNAAQTPSDTTWEIYSIPAAGG